LTAVSSRAPDRRVRVMVVDDSAVVRGLARRWLEAEAHRIDLVKLCGDGQQAIAEAAACQPDVIVLDVEMPRMDGLEALPHLRQAVPQANIVMASALTSKGATVTLKALSLGAADYVAKPEASSLGGAEQYRRELIDKILALGSRRVRGAGTTFAPPSSAPLALRPPPLRAHGRPHAMVIAASTGGPAALQAFLAPIIGRIDAPILIVQHMPAAFTPVFAEKLGQAVGRPCREACDGDVVGRDTFLLAPGDFHLRISASAGARTLTLDKSEPVNFCRPAADPLFETAAQVFGPRLLAVVLTGMGSDGRTGCQHVVNAGGRVIVQDETTSVVWGMPGAVASAGLAEAVRPLNELSQLALAVMNGEG
jgi:two-component system, chemotaxis family, protein-glutamate methylesterase/glutaminase